MKNLMIIFLFLLSSATYAQSQRCVAISGDDTITTGGMYVYTLPNVAQCNNCYDWDFGLANTFGTSIVGTDQQSSVTIQAGLPGTFTLQATYLTEKGCRESCTKTITIIDDVDCDFVEPVLDGEIICAGGTGYVKLDASVNIDNIESVTWEFADENGNYYPDFGFDNNNGLNYIQITAPTSNNFEAPFTFTAGNCNSNPNYWEICFKVIIKYNVLPGDDCYSQEIIVCGTLANGDLQPQPIDNNENQKPIIKISPNPTKSEIQVSLSNLKNKNVELQIYRLNGELLATQKVQNINSKNYIQTISLPKITGEIVLLKIIENNKVIDTKKIIIE